jgi:hypothetical protein
MQRYGDIDRDSGVREYETGPDFIRVRFKDGGTYLYTYGATGASNVETMKSLAASGEGLNSYIMKHVRKNYAAKEA